MYESEPFLIAYSLQTLDSSTLLRAPTRILGSSSFDNGLDIRTTHTLPSDCPDMEARDPEEDVIKHSTPN